MIPKPPISIRKFDSDGAIARQIKIDFIIGNETPYNMIINWMGEVFTKAQSKLCYNSDTVFYYDGQWILYTDLSLCDSIMVVQFDTSFLRIIELRFDLVMCTDLMHILLDVLIESNPDDKVYDTFRMKPFIVATTVRCKYNYDNFNE